MRKSYNSTVANHYNLYASSASIDINSMSTTLPADWKVKFYNGDASCQALQGEISNTGTLAAGAVKLYCAVVSVPANTTLSKGDRVKAYKTKDSIFRSFVTKVKFKN